MCRRTEALFLFLPMDPDVGVEGSANLHHETRNRESLLRLKCGDRGGCVCTGVSPFKCIRLFTLPVYTCDATRLSANFHL